MVAVYAFAAAVVGLVSPTEALQSEVIIADLPVGEYYRPSGALVSGHLDATTPFRRGPCPAVNTLANHGYIPRNGQNVPKSQIKAAVMTHYNLAEGTADFLVNPLAETFDINSLSNHSAFEHDASLVHGDAYFGVDQAEIQPDLLEDLLSRADENGLFGIETFAQIRKERLATCQESNPTCKFGKTETLLAYGECAFILRGLGNSTAQTIDVNTLRSFLGFERFPKGFTQPVQLPLSVLFETKDKIQAVFLPPSA
ncbi:hypothetical protein Poli38472_007291 [Pythium oligandrum]|uniref:Heme haloperoxidase family profile domain-containing protein n=1 Tax=Pythium oligandrum TaxID=41045 RepID=A0A8K1FE84_PYTOL|nr:hypothetical protein Poli38472_007291 [Pythium oligandrum]|eukprot:TMW59146.1 hypothetical protein Poli38472_007291 [Pythium oligandrum]